MRHHAAALLSRPQSPGSPAAAPAAAERLSFSMPDAERWARFSGDRNPIHFDIEQARLLAADRLVVHGMVALLPIRRHIADNEAGAEASGEANGWKRFRAMFRLPVPQDVELELSVRQDGDSARYGLRPVGARQDHIRVQHGPAEPPPAAAWGAALPVPRQRIDGFIATYGAGLPAWMAFEAAVFAELVQSETDPIWEIVRRTAESAWGALPGPPMVVHASHTVWHRASVGAGAAPPSGGDEVLHAIGEVAVETVGDDRAPSLSCKIPLLITVAGTGAVQMEVGLLVMNPAARADGERPGL